MRYMMMIYLDEKRREEVDAKTREATFAAYMAFRDAIVAAGVFVASGQLAPSASATTLRGDRETIEVLDGPFAETKEQLGGFFMIDVPNLDDALEWAKRCPAMNGSIIEVRPMVPIPAPV